MLHSCCKEVQSRVGTSLFSGLRIKCHSPPNSIRVVNRMMFSTDIRNQEDKVPSNITVHLRRDSKYILRLASEFLAGGGSHVIAKGD